jgi:hypothetical protein
MQPISQRRKATMPLLLSFFSLVFMACTCYSPLGVIDLEAVFPDTFSGASISFCDMYALTSPSGNTVNNGSQEFAIDPIPGQQVSIYETHRLTIYDAASNQQLASSEFAQASRSTTLDVSQAAIGGGEQLRLVTVSSYIVELRIDPSMQPMQLGFSCQNERTVTRSVPQAQTSAQRAPDCTAFRLTSPLGGLPNGPITFYWDPIAEATGYQISIYDGGTFLAGWSAPAGSTNLNGNVATSAIGGGFTPLTVVATALLPNDQTCTSQATMGREAPANNQVAPPASTDGPVPTPEPTKGPITTPEAPIT